MQRLCYCASYIHVDPSSTTYNVFILYLHIYLRTYIQKARAAAALISYSYVRVLALYIRLLLLFTMGKASYRSRKQMEEAKKGDKMFKEVKRELEKRAKKKRLAVEEEDIIEEM